MPRHRFGQEAFHLDHLRSSPSQQHLDPTSRSSSSSHQEHDDDLDQDMPAGGRGGSGGAMLGVGGVEGPGAGELIGPTGGSQQRPHKLDLYSIPVFLLECIILTALGYAAYFLHFQYKLEPLLSGFYCDDISLRQKFSENRLTQQFIESDRELTVLALLLAVPLAVIILCELINSMFGSLKFRQISSLCKCCKLHSITRRTLRFSGAYLLGFLIVMISCDILATSAGKFRPYFAQQCPVIYEECFKTNTQPSALSLISLQQSSSQQSVQNASTSPLVPTITADLRPIGDNQDTMADVVPRSPPISGSLPSAFDAANINTLNRSKRDTTRISQMDLSVIERKWIDLTSGNLKQLCQFRGDSVQERKFETIAMSWPSFPSAVISYTCLYLACYLSFVGTARPFRLITSVLVMVLLLAATIFNVLLVNEHYNHWQDIAGSAGLSFVVVVFVLLVYLNKFRDSHYYEKQKLYGSANKRQQQLRKSLMLDGSSPYRYGGYNNEAGQYHLDKIDSGISASAPVAQTLSNGIDTAGGSSSNNDLAMRYFQIPRANYRGAPRPLSAMNRN